MKLTAAIVGATGYTGVELIRLLSVHPSVTLTTITSRAQQGIRVDDYFPSLRGICNLSFTDADTDILAKCDVVFFATPHGVAMKQAKALTNKGVKIIDLAADFRLQDTEAFTQWYKMPHSEPDLLTEAVYGLCEVNREQIKSARIVGNPGCYPTTVLLGLDPLLADAGMIDPRVIVDAKSGVSGAGKKAEEALIFSELNDNFKAYAVVGHRHSAEIYQGLNAKQKAEYDVLFTPHLVPMIRGMFSTIYVQLTDKSLSLDIQSLYEAHYKNEPFVDVMPKGSLPETRSVRASNRLRIALHQHGHNLRILVVQDNLVKGAAGQAVQNMNIIFGLDETAGLLHTPISP